MFAKLIYDYVKLDATYPCFSLKNFSFIFSIKSINVIFHGESVAGSGTELYPVCRLRTNLQNSSYIWKQDTILCSLAEFVIKAIVRM